MSMIPQTVSKAQASFPNSRLIHPATYFPSPLGYLLGSLVQKGTPHSFLILTVPPAGSHRHSWQLHPSMVSDNNPGITLTPLFLSVSMYDVWGFCWLLKYTHSPTPSHHPCCHIPDESAPSLHWATTRPLHWLPYFYTFFPLFPFFK